MASAVPKEQKKDPALAAARPQRLKAIFKRLNGS
jgi:hypothetical protein